MSESLPLNLMFFVATSQGTGSMELSLNTSAKNLRSKVFTHMLKTRGWKYKVFLRYLRFFKYVSFSFNRGEFLEFYYTLMRYLDDIVDGDAPLPEGYINELEYLQEKIDFSLNPVNPRDEVDLMMLHCFELGEKFQQNFLVETHDILNSLMFDAKRRGSKTIFSEEVLIKHFHQLDITGTIKATLKIFKEDPEKYKILEPLGLATRYQFDLEDFEADVVAGYLNFTEEECQLCGIDKNDLSMDSPGIQKWFKYRAKKGMELLDEHHKRLPSGNFKLLTRMTFPLVYEAPARKLFKSILSS